MCFTKVCHQNISAKYLIKMSHHSVPLKCPIKRSHQNVSSKRLIEMFHQMSPFRDGLNNKNQYFNDTVNNIFQFITHILSGRVPGTINIKSLRQASGHHRDIKTFSSLSHIFRGIDEFSRKSLGTSTFPPFNMFQDNSWFLEHSAAQL